MNDVILSDLLDQVAARIVHNNREAINEADAHDNTHPECTEQCDRSNDLDYLFNWCETDLENTIQYVIMEKVRQQLGLEV